METNLIIITLLLIGVFNLLTLLVLGMLLAQLLPGMVASPIKNKSKNVDSLSGAGPVQDSTSPVHSPEEEEKKRILERQYEEQLAAINEMLNYNANVAYGIKPED